MATDINTLQKQLYQRLDALDKQRELYLNDAMNVSKQMESASSKERHKLSRVYKKLKLKLGEIDIASKKVVHAIADLKRIVSVPGLINDILKG